MANWPQPTARLYNMFVPGATHGGSCADGSFQHDHVLSTAPGDPNYTAAWHVIRVTLGPNFNIAKMPYTSENDVLLGAAAGELVLADTGASVRASVVTGNRKCSASSRTSVRPRCRPMRGRARQVPQT